MRKALFLLAVAMVVAGCSSADMKAYIEADKLTYDALAPEYLELVNESDKLDKDQKGRRKKLIETWKMRIDAGLKVPE